MTQDSMIAALVPRNEDAERLLLAALIRGGGNDLYEMICDTGLTAEHFYKPEYADAYRIIAGMIEAGKSATAFTVKPYIDTNIVSDLCDAKIISATKREVRDAAYEITKWSARRGLKDVARLLDEEAVAAEWDKPINDIIGEAQAKLDALTAGGDDDSPVSFNTALEKLSAMIDKAQRPENQTRRVTSGLIDLDNKLGRFRPGELIIMAGRPGQGKTIFALNVATHNAEQGRRGLFFSLEMSEEILVARQLAGLSGVSVREMDDVLSDTKWHKLQTAKSEFLAKNLPLDIDDTPAVKLSDMRRKARKMKRTTGLDFIVVDYLQIMGNDLALRDAGAKTYQIAFNTTGLRNLAKELEVPVICLCQSSRATDKQEDRRPGMADLSDSSSIEKDSDVIMFIHREAYYLEQNKPIQGEREKAADFAERRAEHAHRLAQLKNVAEIICVKGRQADVPFTVEVSYDGARAKLGNLKRTDYN